MDAPLPCPGCIDVLFCSKKCQDEATAGYHKYECGLLETLWSSGSSINFHMALRLISLQPLSFFKGIQAELEKDDLGLEKVKK